MQGQGPLDDGGDHGHVLSNARDLGKQKKYPPR